MRAIILPRFPYYSNPRRCGKPFRSRNLLPILASGCNHLVQPPVCDIARSRQPTGRNCKGNTACRGSLWEGVSRLGPFSSVSVYVRSAKLGHESSVGLQWLPFLFSEALQKQSPCPGMDCVADHPPSLRVLSSLA